MSKCILWVALLGIATALPAHVIAQDAPVAEAEADGSAAPAAAAGDEDTTRDRTLGDGFAMGGWIMYVLVVVSALSTILILERFWATRRGAIIPRRFLQQVRDHAHRRDIPALLQHCAESENAIARVLRAGLVHFEQGLSRMEDGIETAGEHEAAVLNRNLPLLAALGNMSTMFGLLGTVLGMILSFDLIAQTGTGDARVVADGIFQALITTAAGLMVGLYAIAFHSWLRRRVQVLEIELEEKGFRLLEDLWIGRENDEGAAAAAAAAAPAEA